MDQRQAQTGKEIFRVLDNGPCHTSKASQAELAPRSAWLQVIWLARSSPELNKKEREWRYLKREARGQLARDLRSFADAILAGLRRLGGDRQDISDQVPDWFLEGHRKPPTGRKPGCQTRMILADHCQQLNDIIPRFINGQVLVEGIG